MSSFTPGPWEVYQRANGRWYVGKRSALGGSGAVARVMALWDVANGAPGNRDTQEADAHLIAASPDLYAVVKALDELFDFDAPEWKDSWTGYCKIFLAAKAALAKAEGA